MRKFWVAVAVLLGVIATWVASVIVASESGEEIVTLRTFSRDGSSVETRLWVVEHDGSAWLRAGVPNSSWLVRIEDNPVVFVTREGEASPYRAVPVRDPSLRDRIHELMREKYGLADWWISKMRDGAKSVPVRLEPSGSQG